MSDSNARSNPAPKVWQHNFCLAICYSRNTTSKTCELESTFGFISYAISSGNTLGSWEGIPEWEMMLFQFAGFLDGWFLTCNSAPLHVTSLPSSLSSVLHMEVWHWQRKGTRGNKNSKPNMQGLSHLTDEQTSWAIAIKIVPFLCAPERKKAKFSSQRKSQKKNCPGGR